MSGTRYHVVFVAPQGMRAAAALHEVAQTVLHGLRAGGHEAQLGVNRIDPEAVNIVINPQLLGDVASQLPANTILYNFEQVQGDSAWMKPVYVDLVRRFVTWDYSARNVAAWRRFVPEARVLHVPLGHASTVPGIAPAAVEDIDVLFYGSQNERRQKVLQALEARGLRVHAAYDVYGAERDALIARAKVVLNLHFYESRIFEVARVAWLIANRKAVVAEVDADTDIDDDLRHAVAGVPYDALVDRCVALVRDEPARRELAERGAAALAHRDEARILDAALAATATSGAAHDVPLPGRLNAGSGKGWMLEALNVDVDPMWRPDLLADLNLPLASSMPVDLGRFGHRPLPPGSFDEIHASHVLEHVRELVTAMTSFLTLLREGGTLHVEVPYDLSFGAWQDPTHVRAMNERSWLYYTDWYWYLGWSEHRFELVELRFVLSDAGRELNGKGLAGDALLRTPRAVDAMRVILRKVALTPQERTRGQNRWSA